MYFWQNGIMEFQDTLGFAKEMDRTDGLNSYRNAFAFPQWNDRDALYFTGNSLGLQPKRARAYVEEVMASWADLAVEGHFHGDRPWWDYHERLAVPLARLVGADSREVCAMNTLTVNLHLLLVSFYRPKAKRVKILCEEKAFPSDRYMLESQICAHGLDPNETLIEVRKREGETYWRTEDIIASIHNAGSDLALVLIGGVNYYNGQVFDMAAITQAAHSVGAYAGWDLAHAVGNVALDLHGWKVDFAAWCSYKYLNAGPGNAAAIFVHERHLDRPDLPRFQGWWGTRKETRFMMEPRFESTGTADSWQLSNPSILSLAPFLASLTLFDEVGMPALVLKSERLTAYLEFVLHRVAKTESTRFQIITPAQRGCQLSVLLHGQGRPVFDALMREGVIADWREPNVIRLAPAPFYNSFEDVFLLGQALRKAIRTVSV